MSHVSMEPLLAENDYDAQVTAAPDESAAWCGMVKCRLRQGDYTAAVEFAVAALARAPDAPVCSHLLVEAAARLGDREFLALAVKRQVLRFPDEGVEAVRHLVPQNLLAFTLHEEAQDQEDLEAFEQVLRIIRDRRPRRYGQLLHCLLALRPRSIIEIGVFNGRNAKDMILAGGRTLRQARSLRYVGFDLFEEMTPETHEKEFSKYPLSRTQIEAVLSPVNENHTLIQGYTQETLKAFRQSPYAQPVDFVFIDGGHSEETIESDWNNIAPLMSDRTVVIFDDYYPNKSEALDGLGCNSLIERLAKDPQYWVELMPVSDSFNWDFGVLVVMLVKVRLRPQR